MTVTIDELPGPHGIPVLGNLLDIDTHSPIEGFMVMAREYGPIFRLTMPGGGPRLIVSGADLVEEICDDSALRQAGRSGAAATGRHPRSAACSPATPATRSGGARTTS